MLVQQPGPDPVGHGHGGTFTSAGDLAAGTRPLSVAIGDFDADGRKDVVSANHGEKNLSLFLGAGGGAFSPQVKVPAGRSRMRSARRISMATAASIW